MRLLLGGSVQGLLTIAYSQQYIRGSNEGLANIKRVLFSKYSNRYRSYKQSGSIRDLKPTI